MSQRKIPIPNFPLPPAEYSQAYMADILRTYQQAMAVLTNPGEGRNTFLVLTNLQDDDVALEAGSLYKHGNDVKISVLHAASVRGASSTAAAGSVVVVT